MKVKMCFMTVLMLVIIPVAWRIRSAEVAPLTATAIKPAATHPNFQDKKKWKHLKDEVLTAEDEEGNVVPWGVARFYERKHQHPGKTQDASNFEMLVFLKGKGIPVYKQWGLSNNRFQAILQGGGESGRWTRPMPGTRSEHIVHVSRGRMIHFVLMVYQDGIVRPMAYLSLVDPDKEETPAFPVVSMGNIMQWL